MKQKRVDIQSALGALAGVEDKIAIYIPNKDKNSNVIPNEMHGRWIDQCIDLLCEICGGATQMPPARGIWLNTDTQKQVREEPVIIYAYVSDNNKFSANLSKIKAWIQTVGREGNQGQIAVEWNQTLYLINIEESE